LIGIDRDDTAMHLLHEKRERLCEFDHVRAAMFAAPFAIE
jgi:hypothetical protein